jgi:hypothetical protein
LLFFFKKFIIWTKKFTHPWKTSQKILVELERSAHWVGVGDRQTKSWWLQPSFSQADSFKVTDRREK